MGVCIVIGYNLHGKAGMKTLKCRDLLGIQRIRCKAEADGQRLRGRALGKPARKGEQQRQGQGVAGLGELVSDGGALLFAGGAAAPGTAAARRDVAYTWKSLLL